MVDVMRRLRLRYLLVSLYETVSSEIWRSSTALV
jgi:hypothetical protein